MYCFSNIPLTFQWERRLDFEKTDAYRLHVQDRGHSIYRYSQRDVHCNAGSVVLIKSGTESDGAQLSAAGATHIVIPGSLLRTYVTDADGLCGMPLNSNSGMACVLAELISSIWKQQQSIGLADRHCLIAALLRLVAATFEKKEEDQSIGRLYLPYTQIMQTIAANYNDSSFSIGTASKLLNVSPRYIQAVMMKQRTSFSAELMKERMTRSRDLLCQGRTQVTDVALDCGFQNLSHFSRSFRAHFGVSPRELKFSSRQGRIEASDSDSRTPSVQCNHAAASRRLRRHRS